MSQAPITQPPMQQNITGMYTAEPEEFRNLMVNYIPTTIDEVQLRQLFEQCGQIESVKIVCDRNSRQSRGYGFVKYVNSASANSAVNRFNGFELLSKRLKVAFAAAGKHKMNNNMGMQSYMPGYYQQGNSNNGFPNGFQANGVAHPGYPQPEMMAMQQHYMVPQAPQQQPPRQ
eukprot:gene3755-2651_t